MVSPTPKFKTREFREVLAALKLVFDAHSLGILLLDALERQPAEQIYGRMGRQQGGPRLANLKKTEIIGQVTAGFFASDEVAFQVVKEMDRACQKERHIVASIPEDQAGERIGSYRAIALKRERAKLVWALARDDRASVRDLANRIIKEFFKEAAEFEVARNVLEGKEDESALKDIELAKRLKEQAERLAEAAQRVTDLESKVGSFEEERARLLAQMGAKERQLKQESATREELENHLAILKKTLASVENDHQVAEAARASEIEARAMAEELAQKVRRLSKLASVSQQLQDAQGELEQANRRCEELTRELEREVRAREEQRLEHARELEKVRAELESTREELKGARRQLARLEHLAPEVHERAQNPADQHRIALLLDQANLAATAAISFKRKVNFASLLDRLGGGRKVVKAVAFIVDNGGQFFDAFCDTLRKSGWELRVKRPKVFSDGTTKADWDMGLAMEAISLCDDVETIVLASGDGDFAPLIRQLRRRGVRVEVASYPDGLSLDLINVADSVTRLESSTLE